MKRVTLTVTFDAPPAAPAALERKDLIKKPLVPHLMHLQSIQTSLQQALTHALASCATSPSAHTGILRNVTNHISLRQYTDLSNNFTIEDLRRLCWLWEWDGKATKGSKMVEDNTNLFLEATSPSKDWTRGSMGFIITPSTQILKGARVPAYGIGIEVDIDLDNGMRAGMAMAAVARWIAATETRRFLFGSKLDAWTKHHANLPAVPLVPLADLPILFSPLKPSSLAHVFASKSPRPSFSSSKDAMLLTPSYRSRSSPRSPTKQGFAIPVSAISTLPVPYTPSSSRTEHTQRLLRNIWTPTPKVATDDLPPEYSSLRSRNPNSVLQPLTTPRRQALYNRIQETSLPPSPSKSQRKADVPGSKLIAEQSLKLGQKEIHRRCLLGRLGGVAESVWMLFSSPIGCTSTPESRRRRTLPLLEVASSIVKSSPVPTSIAEANESLELLTELCPFFLKKVVFGGGGGEEWLEMLSSLPSTSPFPTKHLPVIPRRMECAVSTNLKHIKREAGGLREVREIIRWELERHVLHEYP